MSSAREYAGKVINLNMGGTAQVGQCTFEQPTQVPKFINIGSSSIGQYGLGMFDGVTYFNFPAAMASWSTGDDVALPNIVDLTRYITKSKTTFAASGFWSTCENGEQTYNANHSDTWEDFCAKAQSDIVWIWGAFREGGCGIVRVNNTQVKFIGTYGVYNNEAGNNERICCTETIPYTIADVTSGCLAVFYNYQRDGWSENVNFISPIGSQVQTAEDPAIRTEFPTHIIYNGYRYRDMADTLNGSKVPFGDGTVPYMTFQLNSVHSPYAGQQPIYYPGRTITLAGYSLEYGSADNGTEGNEYIRGGDSGNNNGNGDYNTDSDPIDPTDESQFSVDAQSCGFVTVYKPEKATLQSFASWLYGTLPTTYGSFLDNIKKLQLNPMDGIISLNISHFSAPTGGLEPIGFYGQPSGIDAQIVSKLTHVVKCGTIHINEFASGWMSYNDLTKIRAYLPYCGEYSLPTNLCMGSNLELRYIIDVLSGACVAEITVHRSARGLRGDADINAPTFKFTGNIFQQVPISAVDYSGIIQGQLGLLSSAASFVSGAATGNFGAMVGGISGAANSITAHPSVETIGSCGASYGYMSCQYPFITQEYPLYNMPESYEKYYGEPIYDYKVIGDCVGLIYVDQDTFWGTDPDRADFIDMTSEEEELLKQAVREGLYMPRTTEDKNRQYYDPNS